MYIIHFFQTGLFIGLFFWIITFHQKGEPSFPAAIIRASPLSRDISGQEQEPKNKPQRGKNKSLRNFEFHLHFFSC